MGIADGPGWLSQKAPWAATTRVCGKEKGGDGKNAYNDKNIGIDKAAFIHAKRFIGYMS
jgi:hypothetical protein